MAAITAIGFGAFGILLALLSGRAATVQGMFPIVLVILFLSSAFFPLNLLSAPAEWIAPYNPLSYIADAIRHPIIAQMSGLTLIYGLIASVAVGVITISASVYVLNNRVAGS
jgi:ABC-2 type transport system permease protein